MGKNDSKIGLNAEKLEKERREYERLQEEARRELERKRKEIEKLEKEVEREKQELELAEAYAGGRTFSQILKDSGLKDKALIERLHIATPTFTARKKGGASLWRLDEVKTLALRLGVNPMELLASLLPEVNIIPEDPEEARKLRMSYSKNLSDNDDDANGEVVTKKRRRGRPRKQS